jgi:hypothetical protein
MSMPRKIARCRTTIMSESETTSLARESAALGFTLCKRSPILHGPRAMGRPAIAQTCSTLTCAHYARACLQTATWKAALQSMATSAISVSATCSCTLSAFPVEAFAFASLAHPLQRDPSFLQWHQHRRG